MTAAVLRRSLQAALALALAGAAAWALWPRPLPVETARVARGEIRVMVEEEGVTRIRDVYTLSAPVQGALQRVRLVAGDPVERGETVLAEVRPADPEFLDARARRVAEAAVFAARAAVHFAEAQLREAESARAFAASELNRAEALSARDTISPRALDRAVLDLATAEAAVASAEAQLDLRKRELESAEARLVQPGQTAPLGDGCCVALRAPVSGRVLRVIAESEQVVQPGQPILEIGDPGDIEIVVDLLSRDAVRVREGAVAEIADWGGDGRLAAAVERIEPYAFTKVSALGIEEQRVRAILRLTDPPERWSRLGHGFRVVAAIEAARAPDALVLPLGALFRADGAWAVFRVERGRARMLPVAIGARTLTVAEVLEGLSEGDAVVVHPSDALEDGARVAPR